MKIIKCNKFVTYCDFAASGENDETAINSLYDHLIAAHSFDAYRPDFRAQVDQYFRQALMLGIEEVPEEEETA